jgi:murein L,D-transpeptidase YafK
MHRIYFPKMNVSVIFAARLSCGIPVLVCLCLLVFSVSSFALASEASEQDVSQVVLVPDPLVSLGSENGADYAILVEKDTQLLMLYEYKDALSLIHEFNCSTGEVAGRKQKSGDRKTPEGIYFFTKAFEEKDLGPIYGTGAFVMDYPNFLDLKFNRGGHNIWLHGSDKPIKPMDSNGCVVLNNDDLEVLSQYIRLNRTPIIISQELVMVPAEMQLASKNSLVEFLDSWKTAFLEGDWAKFNTFYSELPGGLYTLQKVWDWVRTTWQDEGIPFDIRLQDLALLQGNPCVVALFDQVIHVNHQAKVVGTKKIFLEEDGETWKIVGEMYQPSDPGDQSNEPLVAALSHLGRLPTDHKAITDLIAEWVDAWSSKDIRRYAACYAPDFQAKGMDLEEWISYKKGLNRLYDSIQVEIEDLKIEPGPEQSIATFLQRYDSSGYKAVGVKRLRLKRIGEAWKIYRETWDTIHD